MTMRIGILSNTSDLGVMAVRALLVKLLRERHPGAHLTLIAETAELDRVRRFHDALSWVDDYAGLDAEHAATPAERAQARRVLESCRLDLLVLAPESKLPHAIPRRCGIPRRVGFSADPRQRRHLTAVAEIPNAGDRDLHWTDVVDAYARALEVEGYRGAAAHVPFLRAPPLPDDPFAGAPGPRVAVHVGGNPEWNRRWPLARFVELARLLVSEGGASLLLLGGPGETPENRELAAAVRAAHPGAWVRDASGSGVAESAACIAAADLFVGNDSGPMNLAVALGTPVVAVRGADPENFRPDRVDPTHAVLSAWTQCSRHQTGSNACGLGCPVAYDRNTQEYPRCMETISLHSVWTAVARRLPTGARRTSPTAW